MPSCLTSQPPRLVSSSTLIIYAPFLLPRSRSHHATHPLTSLALAFRLRAARRGGTPLAHASLMAAPMPARTTRPRRSACTPALIHMPRRVPAPNSTYPGRSRCVPHASDTSTRPCQLCPCHLRGPTSLSPMSRLRLAHSLRHATITPAPDKSPPTRMVRAIQYSHTSAIHPVHAHIVGPCPCRRQALRLRYNPAAYPRLARLRMPCPCPSHPC